MFGDKQWLGIYAQSQIIHTFSNLRPIGFQKFRESNSFNSFDIYRFPPQFSKIQFSTLVLLFFLKEYKFTHNLPRYSDSTVINHATSVPHIEII